MVMPIAGWFLVARERETPPFGSDKWGPWYIAWMELFESRAEALGFARRNRWPAPFRAVRGMIKVKHPRRTPGR